MTDQAQPSTAVDTVPGEPEKLTIPADLVADLLQAAVTSQIGNALWRGFVAAHGYPSWITSGRWVFDADEAVVKQTPPPSPQNGRP